MPRARPRSRRFRWRSPRRSPRTGSSSTRLRPRSWTLPRTGKRCPRRTSPAGPRSRRSRRRCCFWRAPTTRSRAGRWCQFTDGANARTRTLTPRGDQVARGTRELLDRARGGHRAGIRIGLVILLDVAEIIEIVHHHPVGLLQPALRQIRRPIDAFEAGAVAKVKARDRIDRRAAARSRSEEIGRRRPQHRLAQELDCALVLLPSAVIEYRERRKI